MSQVNTNAIYDASGGQSAQLYGVSMRYGGTNFVNRIINGDMRISQAAAGAAVTTSASFPVDRFRLGFSMDGACSMQQDSSAPVGFVNSSKFTTTTADTDLGTSQSVLLQQRIEGTNVSDLAWGTASASSVTLSFWVRSSLTGTFGGSVQNSASNRSYPFSYAISAANTWEQKTVTIPGDTTGTWLTTTGIGIRLVFSLGAGSSLAGTAGAWAGADYVTATGAVSVVGTLNATWQITGVQLEAGAVATPFERRPFGAELALCQRYYFKNFPNLANALLGSGYNASTTVAGISGEFPVQLRVRPTALEQSGTASDYAVAHGVTGTTCSSVPTFDAPTTQNIFAVLFTVASGLTAGQGCQGRTGVPTTGFLAWSAEL